MNKILFTLIVIGMAFIWTPLLTHIVKSYKWKKSNK
jgi:hypothetical protein